MARTNEASAHGIPSPPDTQGWRHWGDGLAGRLTASRIQGFYSGDATYKDVAVDVNGNLLAALSASSIEIGTVDQGAPGPTAWKVDGSGVTQPVSAAALPLPTGAAKDLTLTDGSQRIGGTVAVSGTFWQSTQPVSIASMPSTPVTGPLTDTQLRASAVPVSLAALPALAAGSALIGHVIVDTAPTTAVTIASMPSTPVTGPLTDTQLRATAVPVSLAALPSISFSAPQHVIVDSATLGTVTVSGSLGRSWTLGSGSDSVSVGNFPAGFANSDDVTDRAARLLGHVTVDNASLPATQSGSWALSGSDGVSTLQVSARQHNGYTHLYVRDSAALGVLSELVYEIRQLRKELHG